MPITVPTSTAIFWWQPACWLRVSGADAATFLQGQFTNDLRALEKTPVVYGLWLTLKGKVLADSFVRRDGTDGFWVGSYFSAAEIIRERLESYVIADDVVIEDQTAGWAGVTVFGAQAEAWRAQPPSEGVVLPGRRTRAPHAEWLFPVAHGAVAREALAGATVLERDTIDRWRIDAGIPAVPKDVGPADLPNEAGLEAEAISYTKGCYLGQEVMARLKSMGKVRRRLLRVRGEGAALGCPVALFAGERQVGELRSAVSDGSGGWFGLAMLSLLHVNATTELALTSGGAATVQLRDQP